MGQMHFGEREKWVLSLLIWFLAQLAYFFVGGFIFLAVRDTPPYSVPEKPQFTLQQLQETPCLGCEWFKFEQTSKDQQYCCRVKDIDVLEHPSECNQKLFCLDQGVSLFNQYSQKFQLNSKVEDQNRVFWSIFWGLTILGLIIIGLFGLRFAYLEYCRKPRPIKRIRIYFSNMFKRGKAPRDTRRNNYSLNEEVGRSSQELQAAGQVKE